jgi:cell division septation protein DedD
MPPQIRAIVLAALQAAAGASLPLVTTQSFELAGATFAVVFALSVLANWFHLNLTPGQEANVAAAVVPAIERLLPALLALLERQPVPVAPPVVTVVPAPAPVAPSAPTVTVSTPAPASGDTVTATVTEQPAAPAPAATP